MRLTLASLERYAALLYPDPGMQAKRDALCAHYRDGERTLDDVAVLCDAAGEVYAGCRLMDIGERHWIISRIVRSSDREPLSREAFDALLRTLLERAREVRARSVLTRPRLEVISPAFEAALRDAGFRFVETRVEFKCPVPELPHEGPDPPLEWRTMDVTGEVLAARMLERVSEGTRHGLDADERGEEALRKYYDDPGLSKTPSCIQIGYLDDEPVAFICAQVELDPPSGWSRITFMGLVPEARGRGLGAWVHRHGFEMLRAQGGRLYHGGTASDNEAMIALFHKHGCAEFATMQEWIWKPGG